MCSRTCAETTRNATPNNYRASDAGNSSLLYAIPGSDWPPNSLLRSLEGSVIEMKPAAPVPVDTAVSLKA